MSLQNKATVPTAGNVRALRWNNKLNLFCPFPDNQDVENTMRLETQRLAVSELFGGRAVPLEVDLTRRDTAQASL
jgi:hypothetical protein